VNLCALEQGVLRFRPLQRFVLDRHERAVRKLLIELPRIRRVAIVGGGLFPRTALILRRLLPDSHLQLIDQSEENLEIARRFLSEPWEPSWERHQGRSHEEEFINERFEPSTPCDSDLLVIPLAFVGDRRALYERPSASAVLVHDWIWRRRGSSAIVSWLLLKRVNLVKR
jgi:hypothetical protein